MICYLDSSTLVRKYLGDEGESEQVRRLMLDPSVTAITGSWTRIEVTGALVRAARAGRGDLAAMLSEFEGDCAPDTGTIVRVEAEQAEIEGIAYALARQRGIRAMDAWHLACAYTVRESLAEADEIFTFATRDAEQRLAAEDLGFASA